MPTYIFVDKAEFEGLKADVAKLKAPKPPEPPKPITPLVTAIGILAVAAIISGLIHDARLSLYAYVIGVVVAQCGVDLYRGESRPRWSAAFRLLALATWYLTQVLSK